MKYHIRKILLSFFVIAAFAVYSVYQRNVSGGFSPTSYTLSDLGATQTASDLNIPTPSAVARKLPVSTLPSVSPKPSATTPPTAKPPKPSSAPIATPTSTPTPTPTLIPTPTPTLKPKSIYNDGQYTGNSADAYYGNVQVAAIIQDGKITDIKFLDYPSDRGHSIQINNYATPILRSEAIQAQSAQVDTVSGATDTSNAFVESLSSALSQARN